MGFKVNSWSVLLKTVRLNTTEKLFLSETKKVSCSCNNLLQRPNEHGRCHSATNCFFPSQLSAYFCFPFTPRSIHQRTCHHWQEARWAASHYICFCFPRVINSCNGADNMSATSISSCPGYCTSFPASCGINDSLQHIQIPLLLIKLWCDKGLILYISHKDLNQTGIVMEKVQVNSRFAWDACWLDIILNAPFLWKQ